MTSANNLQPWGWAYDCVRTYGRVLIGDKAHWCKEWDFLPIDETCPEIEACVCDLSSLSRNAAKENDGTTPNLDRG